MKVFLDSSVIIAAAKGNERASPVALALAEDPGLTHVSSVLVKMEAWAPPLRSGFGTQARATEAMLDKVSEWIAVDPSLCEEALAECCRVPGLLPVDALLVCSARRANALFLTMERLDSPMFKVPGAVVQSLHPRELPAA